MISVHPGFESNSHSLELTTPTSLLAVSVHVEAIMSGQHTLPDLPYAYDALEPFISRQIMELHHKKHHQTYVNALNAAEASYAKSTTPKERIALQAALRFNGGGKFSYPIPPSDHVTGGILSLVIDRDLTLSFRLP
jgi:hypothetical protein